VVWTTPVQDRDTHTTSSVSTYYDVRDRSRSFESVGAFNGGGCGVRSLGAEHDGSPAERVFGQCFSPSLFQTLGIRPMLGRTFNDQEDRIDYVAPVVVITHRFWQRRFGGDPQILGRTMVLNRITVTVIGVLPPDFDLFKDPNAPSSRAADLDFIAP